MTACTTDMSVRYSCIGRFFVVFGLLMLTACAERNDFVAFSGEAQGTYYSVSYYDAQHRNFKHSIDSLLDDFDQTASLWVDSSMIRRVNANLDSVVSPMFVDLLNKSLWTYHYTNHAFDCTVGQLVNAWGFGFSKGTMPSDDTVAQLMQYLGSDGLSIVDGNILRKRCTQTMLDFNAIAQGYSVDLIADFLSAQGVEDYLVDVGGEVIAHGAKPDGSSWRVGIERPADNKYSSPEVELAISLDNQSVVTSGNYRKYYVRDGVKYSHTINPQTGHPVNHSLLSVSVVADSAWKADALATAFMVMGLDESKRFIADHPDDEAVQAVFFIYDEQGIYKTYATPLFNELIIK